MTRPPVLRRGLADHPGMSDTRGRSGGNAPGPEHAMQPRRRQRRWPVLAGVSALAALLLSGCADNRQNVLSPEGRWAEKIADLTYLALGMATVVGLFVGAAIVVIIFRYRRGRGDPDRVPTQTHGNMPAEIGWTIAPAVLLVILAVPTVAMVFELNSSEDDAMVIGVEGNQWWWRYTYDLDSDGETDIVTANEIVFPADTEIELHITSNDVIHSFWIPELNGKRDAVPGLVSTWKLQANEPGLFWGHCTEFCGLAHGVMRMRAIALSPEDWEVWVARNLEPATEPPDQDTPERRGFEAFGQFCASCHVVNGVYEAALEGEVPLQSGVAPNLTHLTSRTSFAGSLFDLYMDDGSLNVGQLREWVLDAPGQVPMAPDNQQGMPSFVGALGAQQLDDIIAYLASLDGEPPILPDGVPITGQ
jgi:cytochrome c oxidase subunit II